MEIVKQDFLINLKQIVAVHAKYQKVMLLYDENATNSQISSILSEIKEICIFNKMDANNLDLEELNNGYKLIVYLMSGNSFLNLNFSVCEFVNIFIPTNEFVLPFFADENFNLNTQKNFLFLSKDIDISIETSVMFNKIYEYINGLVLGQVKNGNLFELNSITQNELMNLLNDETLFFYDLKIIKNVKIDVKFLPVVDVVLISAIQVLIDSILENNLALVDCYKAVKNDEGLIEKFYAFSTNNVFCELVKLNKVNLKNLFFKLESKLKNLTWYFQSTSKETIEKIILQIKDYLKDSTDFLFNLYLYNLFGV